MKTRSEKLRELQRERQSCYEDYLCGRIDRHTYLVSVYPIDCAVDRLELSFLYGHLRRVGKREK